MFCKWCGVQVSDTAFCTRCGGKLKLVLRVVVPEVAAMPEVTKQSRTDQNAPNDGIILLGDLGRIVGTTIVDAGFFGDSPMMRFVTRRALKFFQT